ncbi:phosphatase PAP2 family protein [Rhodocaloribacter litoris]|uniref:phosphatase PAP2 family protein n=1 Tax=Rhodocaloribacter litoris TaxID=2558931 RepID=UPI00141F84B2|nr:phosphatase PAP2 family protein [Rhodocaloribacter litoris]QXD15452.1 phosphatase PAP2 family protein [Rhodocaloribacter litoris]
MRFVGLLVLAGLGAGAACAQPADTLSLDARLFLHVYRADLPGVDPYLHAVDATAYPVFFGAPAVAWGAALVEGGVVREAAYRLALSWGTAAAGVFGLKYLVRRPRPYAVLPGVRGRTGRHRTGGEGVIDPYSFPSGHATLAFALATSWSLSYPRWYVVAPGMLWAGSVALSRVRFGVHYPSDVLAGALLGAGVAATVHLLRHTLTPAFLRADEPASRTGTPVVHLRIVF